MGTQQKLLNANGKSVADQSEVVQLRLVDASDGALRSAESVALDAARLTPIAELMRREQAYRHLLAGADGVASIAAVLCAVWVLGLTIKWPIVAVAPFLILVSKVQGLYDRDELVIRKSTLAEWRELVEATAIFSICVYLSWRVLTSAAQGPGMRLFLFLVVSTTLLAIIGRTFARRLARQLTVTERCLIVGDLHSCRHLGETISSVKGVELIGAVAIDELSDSLEDVKRIVVDLNLHRLIVAPHARSSDAATLELVRNAKLLGVRVSILPSVLAAVGSCAAFDELDGHTLLGVPRFGLTKSSSSIKRTFDIAGSVWSILLLAPLMLGIAILIRLDSPGPIVFRQSRIGRGARPFFMLKFRSMVDGADAMKNDLLLLNEAHDGLFKIAKDPRITRVGRWLRASHLDELPQLFNVLRGEMSLVGPRPLVAEEDIQIAGGDRIRLSLTPGITGPWQVCGPMTTPLSEMVKLDYLYISNWSLWRDVDILLKTTARVLTRGGH